MKIVKVRITDESGVEHEFEGKGYMRIFNPNRHGEPVKKILESSLVLEGVQNEE